MRRPGNNFPAETPPTVLMVRRLIRFWWALLLLPLVVVGGLMAVERQTATHLDRAEAQLQDAKWEAALAALQPVTQTPFLSLTNQRRAATLLFRLGEDQQAYTLLAARPLRPNDPADATARDLAARCYTSSVLRRQADTSRDSATRLRLARAARKALPEAPRVLEWVVREEVLAMVGGANEEQAFERDYATLRLGAPVLADRVKQAVAAAQAQTRIPAEDQSPRAGSRGEADPRGGAK